MTKTFNEARTSLALILKTAGKYNVRISDAQLSEIWYDLCRSI